MVYNMGYGAASRITYGRMMDRSSLSELLQKFSRHGRELVRRHLPFAANGAGAARSRAETMTDMARDLISNRGEASGVAVAVGLQRDEELIEQHLAQRVARAMSARQQSHRPIAVAGERRLYDREFEPQVPDLELGECLKGG